MVPLIGLLGITYIFDSLVSKPIHPKLYYNLNLVSHRHLKSTCIQNQTLDFPSKTNPLTFPPKPISLEISSISKGYHYSPSHLRQNPGCGRQDWEGKTRATQETWKTKELDKMHATTRKGSHEQWPLRRETRVPFTPAGLPDKLSRWACTGTAGLGDSPP